MVRQGASGDALLSDVTIMGSAGSKKTIILSHGYGGEQSVWRHLVPWLLVHGHRVVTFDLVFSAASSFEDYADGLISLMDELDIKSSFFLGHSMSAMIGCKAAVKRPELFRHLIFLCGSPRYLNATNYEGGFELSAIEEMLANMEKDFYSWTLAFAPAALGTQDPKLCKEFQSSLLRMNPEEAIPLLRTIFLTDNREVLQKVLVPSTIIQTQKDMVVPLPVAQYLHEKLGGESSVVIIPVDGHTPQLTAPKLLINALEKALEYESPCSV
ncbi:probable esterase KAI2 [Nymphaea colorata]|nr:probable esterase KAI2 [Nymphaea colorata]